MGSDHRKSLRNNALRYSILSFCLCFKMRNCQYHIIFSYLLKREAVWRLSDSAGSSEEEIEVLENDGEKKEEVLKKRWRCLMSIEFIRHKTVQRVTGLGDQSQVAHFLPEVFTASKGVIYFIVHVGTTCRFSPCLSSGSK